MKTISLVGAASYLPRRLVDNAFFAQSEQEQAHAMFRGVKMRHHVSPDETAEMMIVIAQPNRKRRNIMPMIMAAVRAGSR